VAESWDSFCKKAVGDTKNATGQTKSFKDIKLKTVYNLSNPRLVSTHFGKRIIVTVTETGPKGESEDRWCFPRLYNRFVDADGEIKEDKIPVKIGFTSRYPDPYEFKVIFSK
jgi:hypothetical protein